MSHFLGVTLQLAVHWLLLRGRLRTVYFQKHDEGKLNQSCGFARNCLFFELIRNELNHWKQCGTLLWPPQDGDCNTQVVRSELPPELASGCGRGRGITGLKSSYLFVVSDVADFVWLSDSVDSSSSHFYLSQNIWRQQVCSTLCS